MLQDGSTNANTPTCDTDSAMLHVVATDAGATCPDRTVHADRLCSGSSASGNDSATVKQPHPSAIAVKPGRQICTKTVDPMKGKAPVIKKPFPDICCVFVLHGSADRNSVIQPRLVHELRQLRHVTNIMSMRPYLV